MFPASSPRTPPSSPPRFRGTEAAQPGSTRRGSAFSYVCNLLSDPFHIDSAPRVQVRKEETHSRAARAVAAVRGPAVAIDAARVANVCKYAPVLPTHALQPARVCPSRRNSVNPGIMVRLHRMSRHSRIHLAPSRACLPFKRAGKLILCDAAHPSMTLKRTKRDALPSPAAAGSSTTAASPTSSRWRCASGTASLASSSTRQPTSRAGR